MKPRQVSLSNKLNTNISNIRAALGIPQIVLDIHRPSSVLKYLTEFVDCSGELLKKTNMMRPEEPGKVSLYGNPFDLRGSGV